MQGEARDSELPKDFRGLLVFLQFEQLLQLAGSLDFKALQIEPLMTCFLFLEKHGDDFETSLYCTPHCHCCFAVGNNTPASSSSFYPKDR